MNEHIKPATSIVEGRPQAFYVDDETGVWTPASPIVSNTTAYDWGGIVAALLSPLSDGNNYTVNGMYIEFDNSGSSITPPAPADPRDATAAEYLASSGTRDFLRVPLVATARENSDSGTFSADNKLTFHGQTSGILGQRTPEPALDFTAGATSNVIGGALVAMLDDDIANDLIFARFYFDEDDQVAKLASSQIGITWPVTFN